MVVHIIRIKGNSIQSYKLAQEKFDKNLALICDKFFNTLRTKGFFQVDPGNPQLKSYFPIGMIKYHDQNQLREETVITTYSSYRGTQLIVSKKAWLQEQEPSS